VVKLAIKGKINVVVTLHTVWTGATCRPNTFAPLRRSLTHLTDRTARTTYCWNAISPAFVAVQCTISKRATFGYCRLYEFQINGHVL